MAASLPAKENLIERGNNLKDWASYESSLLYPLRKDYIFFKEIPVHCYVASGTTLIRFGPILMIAYKCSSSLIITWVLSNPNCNESVIVASIFASVVSRRKSQVQTFEKHIINKYATTNHLIVLAEYRVMH